MHTRASNALNAWLRGSTKKKPRTQALLAERLTARAEQIPGGRGVNQSSVSAWCTGTSVPHLDMVLMLRDELGIKPDWWLVAEPPEAAESGTLLTAAKSAVPKTGTK